MFERSHNYAYEETKLNAELSPDIPETYKWNLGGHLIERQVKTGLSQASPKALQSFQTRLNLMIAVAADLQCWCLFFENSNYFLGTS